MSVNVDRFIDLLGCIDDKYIRLAAPKTERSFNLKTDVYRVDLSSYPKIQEKPAKKKNKIFTAAVVSLAAAALVITGGVLIWNRLQNIPVTPSDHDIEAPVEILEDPDIRNLKWGMTLEEVRAHETAEKVNEEILDKGGTAQFLLNYKNVEFHGFTVDMVLSVMYDTGLDGVNYRIPAETPEMAEELFDELAYELKDTQNIQYDDSFIFKDFPEEGYTVMLQNAVEYVQYSYFPLIDWDEELIDYTGNNMLTQDSFDVFEKYFYGKWTDNAGIRDLTFDYSTNSEYDFDFWNGKLLDIHTDDNYAYMYTYGTVEGAEGSDNTLIDIMGAHLYLVDIGEGDTLYRYDMPDAETAVAVEKYAATFTKSDEKITETDSLGFFGLNRVLHLGSFTNSEALPIEDNFDYEWYLKDRASALHYMVYNYLNNETGNLVYKLGEGGEVIDDTLKSEADFKAIFSDKIESQYFDFVNSFTPNLEDRDGKLYYNAAMSGYLGTLKTWLIGIEKTEYSIIGHFAELGGIDPADEDDPEYVNDLSHYGFYDIVVQNIGGEYVVTNCVDLNNPQAFAFKEHGLFYQPGYSNKNITNEAVKPLSANENDVADKSALLMLGNETENDGNVIRISDESWTVSNDYTLFRNYFFGNWGGYLEISDAESQNFYYKFTNFFDDFYTVGEDVLAFVTGGSAGAETYWINKNEPDVMYIAQGEVGDFPNCFGLTYGSFTCGKLNRTNRMVPEPENDYCSVFRLREYADALGFDRGLLTDFEELYPDTGIVKRKHDDKYYFYPVYLVESDKGYLVFRTTVGNPYDPENDIEVVYAIDGTSGEWVREIISETPINQ